MYNDVGRRQPINGNISSNNGVISNGGGIISGISQPAWQRSQQRNIMASIINNGGVMAWRINVAKTSAWQSMAAKKISENWQ